jgi:hypothetical protein
MTIQPSAIAFVGHLVWRFPELSEVFAEHVYDEEGVLPHVFMADVERFAEALLVSAPDRLASLLLTLEEGYASGDPAVTNLVDVSFVESLPYPGEANSTIRDLLPAGLRSLLRHG